MERHDKRLTEHFCLDEFTYSGIAVDNAINNQPPPCACLALQNLAVGLLEPLRLLYGAPIAILSGYRNEKVNRLAGGVVTSQHLKGEAADCYVADGPEKLLDVLQCSGLVFDQAILYGQFIFAEKFINLLQVIPDGPYGNSELLCKLLHLCRLPIFFFLNQSR